MGVTCSFEAPGVTHGLPSPQNSSLTRVEAAPDCVWEALEALPMQSCPWASASVEPGKDPLWVLRADWTHVEIVRGFPLLEGCDYDQTWLVCFILYHTLACVAPFGEKGG